MVGSWSSTRTSGSAPPSRGGARPPAPRPAGDRRPPRGRGTARGGPWSPTLFPFPPRSPIPRASSAPPGPGSASGARRPPAGTPRPGGRTACQQLAEFPCRQRHDQIPLFDANYRVAGQPGDELSECPLQVPTVLGLERHLDLVVGVRELRIGPEQQERIVLQQIVQEVREGPLSDADEHAPEVIRLL